MLRRGRELSGHINAISTFKVGRTWRLLVGLLAPIVLGYMLVTQIVSVITNGYEGLPPWYLNVLGWGTIAFIVVLAVVLSLIPWRRSPDAFTAWPPTDAATAASRSGKTKTEVQR